MSSILALSLVLIQLPIIFGAIYIFRDLEKRTRNLENLLGNNHDQVLRAKSLLDGLAEQLEGISILASRVQRSTPRGKDVQ